jgi:hypothetical protein
MYEISKAIRQGDDVTFITIAYSERIEYARRIVDYLNYFDLIYNYYVLEDGKPIII